MILQGSILFINGRAFAIPIPCTLRGLFHIGRMLEYELELDPYPRNEWQAFEEE
jgi:hypothetical protein